MHVSVNRIPPMQKLSRKLSTAESAQSLCLIQQIEDARLWLTNTTRRTRLNSYWHLIQAILTIIHSTNSINGQKVSFLIRFNCKAWTAVVPSACEMRIKAGPVVARCSLRCFRRLRTYQASLHDVKNCSDKTVRRFARRKKRSSTMPCFTIFD